MAEYLSDFLTKVITDKRKLLPNETGRNGVLAAEAKATVLAAHSDGDIYRLFRVPSNGIPIHVGVSNSAITDGTDYDLGLYQVGGAVADKDVLIDGFSMATASTGRVVVGAFLIANAGKQFWELAGASADPGGFYDVCLTANTVGSADGTVFVTLTYNANR